MREMLTDQELLKGLRRKKQQGQSWCSLDVSGFIIFSSIKYEQKVKPLIVLKPAQRP